MPDDTQSVKRRSERKRVQIAVTVVIEGDEAEHLATTVDLSRHGVRLQSDATLAPGQPVGLLLATDPDCFINARVVWVGKADSAQAGQAGFEFLDLLTGPVC
jgi:hypothetical protein